MMPRESVREVDMSVDEALKYIISMGVVAPRRRTRPHAAQPGASASPTAPAAEPRN
jgi:uncharacterized membrane protein